MELIFVLLFIIIFFILNRRERYDALQDEMADRWVDVLKSPYGGRHKYINQIDFYRNAPNIDLGRVGGGESDHLNVDNIDWSKLNDYQYSQVVGLIQGIEDRPRIKSINAN